MSSNPQDSAQEGSTNNLSAVISSSSSLVNNNASNSQENNENEMNSSIGSNRSLNNIFPFRINRNIILNNVFQEIRPLVNTTTSNAPFASWMRSSLQSVNTTANNEEQHSQSDNNNRQEVATNDTSSVIINIGSPSTSYNRQNSAPARTSTESNDLESPSVNQSRTSLQQGTDPANNNISSNNNSNNSNVEEPNAVDGNADNIAHIPEARALINTVSRYFPYVCILFAKTCYDHLDGLLDIFALFIVFAHSNFTLKQEITKQAQRRFLYLIRELLYIILVVTIIAFLLEKKENSISLFFAPLNIPPEEKQLALKDLLFSVIITDLILKLFTVAVKILFTMLPRRCVEFKNRGRVYLLIEAFSQLYRALVPIQLWLTFLLESYKGTEKIMGVILSAAYIVAKGSDLLQRIKFLKRSFIKFLQKTSFGTTPTKEQIQAAGGTCSICHDNYVDPVILNECTHIFCELCLLGWLDRSNSTCPLCRANIDQDNPGYRDGSTTFFIQFY
ncbi:RING finger and transmembrane domain-containing protein 2 [Chironomus tepperi]|uniref:RING finger and transmembrane domain-containing protein 2 n=1 Tax=Chironomus tepperi TaxID=113505 RepID=UPI00391F9047